MIKISLNISDTEIKELCKLNTQVTGKPTIIDEERLAASNGIELNLDDLVQNDSEEERIAFGQFLMGVTASAITYLQLLKPEQ